MSNIDPEAFHNCKYCPLVQLITGEIYSQRICALSGEELETEFDHDKHFYTAKNQPCQLTIEQINQAMEQLTTIKQQKTIEKTKEQTM